MDDELRQALASICAQQADIATDARAAHVLARENAHETVKLARRFDTIEVEVKQLKSAVFGSDPPPAVPVPLPKRITQGEGDIAELAGQLIAVKSELTEVKKLNEEQSGDIGEIKRQQVVASADAAARALVLREVRKDVGTFFAKHPGLSAALVALGTAAAGAATAWLQGRGH